MASTSPVPPPGYPLRLTGVLDRSPSRWLWLVKWILLIPHIVVLGFLWIGAAVVWVIALFAILFTGRYPRPLFTYTVGVMRWSWRVSFYGYSALGTDRYPPFSFDDDPDYPARLEVDYPERLSNGLVLIKWWLLAIPHYLILGAVAGGTTTVITNTDGVTRVVDTGGSSLVAALILIVAIALLVVGRYPLGLFRLLLGINRWGYRVSAYVVLLTDAYPPFRLDMGATEPAPELAPAPATEPRPPADPATGT